MMRPMGGTVAAAALAVLLLVTGAVADELKARAGPDRRTENILLITTDGLRWQEVFAGAEDRLMSKQEGGVADVDRLKQSFWRDTPQQRRAALLPFVWGVIARQGQLFGNANQGSVSRVTNGMNFSYPGYNELLTGSADARIASNAKRLNPNVSVLEWLNQDPRWRGKVATFGSWDVYPYILNRDRSGLYINAGWQPLLGVESNGRIDLLNRLTAETPRLWEDSRYDSFTFQAALEYFRQNKPRLLYVAFDDTDEFAHAGRYDHYLTGARRVDEYIKALWDEAQSLPQFRDKTTLIVTTDHGRGDAPTGWKNHGALVPGSDRIWIAVMGPDTPRLGERANIAEVLQSQVASTVAALVGEDFRAFSSHAGAPIGSVLIPAVK
jgi:Type I phosphodiesterase / nucleotide pyrophosphatase